MAKYESCRWVLQPATKEKEAVYCKNQTGYFLKTDDDDNKIRKYHAFCKQHLEIVEKEDN